MFVSERALLPVSFATAQVRLADTIAAGTLLSVARLAYDEHGTAVAGHRPTLVRVGPLPGLPGASRLVRVHFSDLTRRGETAVLALRWEATGPGGRLFPALDADITLAPAGDGAEAGSSGHPGRRGDGRGGRDQDGDGRGGGGGDGDGDGTTMTLDGAYRPPLGQVGAGLDRAVLHRAATATIRRFLALLGETIAAPEPGPGDEPGPR